MGWFVGARVFYILQWRDIMYKFILSTYTKFRTVPEWYLKAANNGHAQAKLMLSGLQ